MKPESVKARVKKPSAGTVIGIHFPAALRVRVDAAAAKSGLSKQDFYRLCLEVGMVFWDEAGFLALSLHDAGKSSEEVAQVRAKCEEYGLFLPEKMAAKKRH